MYEELVKRLRYCSEEQSGCGLCALSSDCVLRVGLLTQAADAIEELSKERDEKTALAMMAGAHAIRAHAKRYEGSTYVWDVFEERGGPKEICYLEAAKHLMSTASSILDPEPPKEES